MTERSMFWTDSVGDGGPYSQDQLRLLWSALGVVPSADEGVLPGQLQELRARTQGNNNVTIGTGRALVDGTLYESNAEESLTITSPSGGTTGKRVVLRKTWAARTVRLTVISSPDGTASLPAPTQSDGVTWDIPVCSFTITTGGAIGALTDERRYAGVGFETFAAGRMLASNRALLAYHDFVNAQVVSSDGLFGGLGLYWDRSQSGTSHAASTDAINGKVDHATGTTNNSNTRIRTQSASARGSLNPRFATSLIPQASAAALAVQLFGFFSASAPATGTSNSKAAIRSATTGNLFFVTGNGSSEQTTDLGVAPATQTTIEIRTDDAGASWQCYLNGVLVASHSTTIPVASTAMYAMVGIANNTTTSVGVTQLDYIVVDQDRS